MVVLEITHHMTNFVVFPFVMFGLNVLKETEALSYHSFAMQTSGQYISMNVVVD